MVGIIKESQTLQTAAQQVAPTRGSTSISLEFDQPSVRHLDHTVWCDVTRREVSYLFGKPPIFGSFASSVARSRADARASFARTFCRFSFR
jgi:hypothetical protein